MKKNVLLTLSALTFGGFSMMVSAQDIFMAAGQKDVNYISFKEVKTLNVNSFDGGKVFFTKAALQSPQATVEQKNCGCDVFSPTYIAAMTVDNNGDIVTMNMAGTKIYKYLQNGDIQTIDIPNDAKTVTEQNLFARMTTTPDGTMYALNNVGTQLVKIAKDGTITNLGEVDGFNAIFRNYAEQRTCYGGDMIADDKGNLLVFTAFGSVVKINPQTISAEYVGQISGLPEGYSVNGVAVASDNTIVIASSQPKGLYATNMETLTASFFGENDTPTYDLASNNFLKEKSVSSSNGGSLALSPTVVKQERAFNIVATSELKNATVAIYGMDGKMISKQAKNLNAGETKININGLSSGIYLVNVLDKAGNKLLTEKITVE